MVIQFNKPKEWKDWSKSKQNDYRKRYETVTVRIEEYGLVTVPYYLYKRYLKAFENYTRLELELRECIKQN